MATTYYCRHTNTYGTCDSAQAYDLGGSAGSGSVTGSTVNTSFTEIITFDMDATGLISTDTHDVVINIASVAGLAEFRYRIQQIDDGTCAATNSSSYSSTSSATGDLSASLALTWTGSDGILRISIEGRRTGGAAIPIVVEVNVAGQSYIDVADLPVSSGTQLQIVRDLWWLNTSGSNYLINENNQLSSYNTGLYRSIIGSVGSDDSKYIEARATSASTIPYYFRVSHDHIVPSIVNIDIRYQAGATVGGSPIVLTLSINGVSFGTIGSTTNASATTESVSINLTDSQRKAILDARQNETYDYFLIEFDCDEVSPLNGAKLYDIAIYYKTNTDEYYFVHQSNIPGASVNWFYPVGIAAINTTWKNDSGTVLSSSDLPLIAYSGEASGADSRYIQCWNEPPQMGLPTPQSGSLTINFNVGDTYNYNAKIARTNLYVRLSLPNSGTGNQRDVYQVVGHSPHIGSGNILWGSGGIVETSGFRLFNTELCWTNPWLRSVVALSGNRASTQFRSAESLRDLSLRLIGLPSGTQLSAAALRVEAIPSNSLSLRTIGGNVEKRTIHRSASGYSNTGGTAYNRYRGYSFVQNSGTREIFNLGYYQFNERSGPVIYSEVNNASGVYLNTTTLSSGSPTRTHYYTNRSITKHDDWRNAIFLTNPSSIRDTHLDFYDRVHASGEHSFFLHITSDSNRFEYDNLNGNILLYRGNGTNHEYIVNIKSNILNYNIFDQFGAIEETLSYNLGTKNTALVLGTFKPSVSGANGMISLYGFSFDGSLSYSTSSGINTIQYSNSYTSIGSRNLAASITDMDENYTGWIHELGFGNRLLEYSNAIQLFSNRYEGFNFTNQTTGVNSQNNNYLEFEFNPASGNMQESLSVTFNGSNAPIRSSFPGFYEIDYPQYTNYGFIPVNPSAVQLEMVLSHETNHPSGVYLTGIVSPIDDVIVYETFGSQVIIPSSDLTTIKTTLFTKNTVPVTYDKWDYNLGRLLVQFKHDNNNYYSKLKIHSIKMNIDALMEKSSTSGSLNLMTDGAGVNSSLDLYVHNNYIANNFPLFIGGIASHSGSVNLHTLGSTVVASLPLYTHGQPVYLSGALNLYTSGIYYESENLNLSLVGTTPPKASGSLQLRTWATTNSGVYGTQNLYLNSDLDDDYSLNLFLAGASDSGETSSILNLILGEGIIEDEFLYGYGMLYPGAYNNSFMPTQLTSNYGTYGSNTNIDTILRNYFFIPGENVSVTGTHISRALTMSLVGTTPSNFGSGSLNLFMSREAEGLYATMPMYLHSPTPYYSGNLNLYSYGILSIDNSMNLFTKSEPKPSGTLKLYSHGF